MRRSLTGGRGAIHRRFRVVPHAWRATSAAADLEGFAHSAAADGEKSSSAGQAEQPKEAVIWTYVFACPSLGGHVELRLCKVERRRWLAGDMDFF